MGKTVKVKIKREQLDKALGTEAWRKSHSFCNEANVFFRVDKEIEIELHEEQIDLKGLVSYSLTQGTCRKHGYKWKDIPYCPECEKIIPEPKRKRFKILGFPNDVEAAGHVSWGDIITLEEVE